jgi:hypothetical protein
MGYGREKKILKTIPTGQRTMSFSAKCSDMFSGTLTLGDESFNLEGDVPSLGIGSSDYIELNINLQTGQILNWKPPTDVALKEAVNGEDYYEDDEE